jgi:hypothetical protein
LFDGLLLPRARLNHGKLLAGKLTRILKRVSDRRPAIMGTPMWGASNAPILRVPALAVDPKEASLVTSNNGSILLAW